jgi:hypothetical protein
VYLPGLHCGIKVCLLPQVNLEALQEAIASTPSQEFVEQRYRGTAPGDNCKAIAMGDSQLIFALTA